MQYAERRVVVIGAGAVGTTYIYSLMDHGLADEIVLIDIDKKRVEGEVMDLSHGAPFIPPVRVRGGEYSDCAGANIVVITAGAKQVPGQSRLDLIRKNAAIVKTICEEIKKVGSEGVIVMVTNPVDTLTQVAIETLGWERGRIIGSGTVLDTARFRYMLSSHCGIDSRNVHGYILGEHGDSEVAAWSMTTIGGMQIDNYCKMCGTCDWKDTHQAIAEQVRKSAYHIIDYKGSTYYGIGLSLVRISGTILRNEHSVLTVSSMLKGEYGIDGVCLSVPCVIGENGIERVIEAKLRENEMSELRKSAETLREVYLSIKGQ